MCVFCIVILYSLGNDLQLYIALIILPSDVTVKFEPVLYHVVESSMEAVVRLVLLGNTSNTVAVTVGTHDQDAMCRCHYSLRFLLYACNYIRYPTTYMYLYAAHFTAICQIVVHSLSYSAPSDYHQMMSTAVVFAAGETEQSVVISIVDDRVLEEMESFSIEISSVSSGVTVENGTASIVIEDDDGNSIIYWMCVHTCENFTGVCTHTEIPFYSE